MKKFGILLLLFLLAAGSAGAGYFWAKRDSGEVSFPSPFEPPPSPKPLLAYTIPALSQRQPQASQIVVEEVITDQPTYTAYLFSYITLGKRMTGQLNVPKPLPASASAIVMLRGYVPQSTYQTGIGTRNAARIYAENGFITLAPDFFSHGGSDPEPEDGWQARFEKPINVLELIATLETKTLNVPVSPDDLTTSTSVEVHNIGLWGHSNGGQIALTTLEILQRPLPTTLWAPVTVPFPYSVLFFTDEADDEGKGMRAWLSIFERDYDVFDFTLTKHLDKLTGPLQIHHGTNDDAALKAWSDEFVDKIRAENTRRAQLVTAANEATASAVATPSGILTPIEYSYFIYPGADHNLQPGWNTVVERDLEFFKQTL